MIDVTLLGTAATMPLPDRALTSAVLSCAGHSILFDCGEGTQTAARRAHISLMKTDMIALTHFHGDHIFGLPGLLQTYGCLGRTEDLFITGPDGLEDVMQSILALSGPLPFSVITVKSDDTIHLSDLIPGWTEDAYLSPFRTVHRTQSLGYRFFLLRPGKFNPLKAEELGVPKTLWSQIQRGRSVSLPDGRIVDPSKIIGPARKGLSVVFSGDTRPCDSLLLAAHDANLLICESTYGDSSYKEQAVRYGHSIFSEAAETAKAAGARRLWLTHFSQIMENPRDFLSNASDIFPDAVCGEDGLRIQLKFEED